jgi:hypothetical protein
VIRVEPKPLEKPASTSGESVANSIWAKAALPMRLPLRLLVALLAGGRARSHRNLICFDVLTPFLTLAGGTPSS